MAIPWIKIEVTTADKPEIDRMADHLQMDPDAVLGKLIRVWSWFDVHTADGHAQGVTSHALDRRINCPGFAGAMKAVGWLIVTDAGDVEVPNFDTHNGDTAKKRAQGAKRQGHKREQHKSREAVTQTSRSERDNSVTRGDENREDIKPSPSGEGVDLPADEVLSAWNKNMRSACRMTDTRRRQLRARWRDPWWRQHWREAIDRACKSSFLAGDGDKGWRADLAWFLKPDSATKILEGAFDDRASPANANGTERSNFSEIGKFLQSRGIRDGDGNSVQPQENRLIHTDSA